MSRSTANWIFVTPLVIAVIWFIEPALTGGSIVVDEWIDLAGFLTAVSGLIIRVVARDWKACRSHAGLVTTGPYSIVRHPMYIASYLTGIGLCIIMGNLNFTIGFTIIYVLVHVRVAQREERFLSKTFGDEYKTYRSSVPAVIPSPARLLKKMMTGKPWISSKKTAILREMGTICGILAGAVALEARETLYLEGGWTGARNEMIAWAVIGGVILLLWLVYAIKRPNTDPVPL